VVGDKTTLPDPFKVMRGLDLYVYFVTELIQLIPSAKRDSATLILDEFGSATQLRTELRRFMTVRGIPRHFRRVIAKRSRREGLIPIADLLAGALLRRDSRRDAKASEYVEPKFKRVLEFRGYQPASLVHPARARTGRHKQRLFARREKPYGFCISILASV